MTQGFSYEFLVWYANRTAISLQNMNMALIKRLRLNYIFAFLVFNLDHESAMLPRFRNSLEQAAHETANYYIITDQLIFEETDNTYIHLTDKSMLQTKEFCVAETAIRIVAKSILMTNETL